METLSATEFKRRYGSQPTLSTPKTPGYFSRVAAGVGAGFSRIAEATRNVPDDPNLRDEVRAGLSVARGATEAAVAPIIEAPGIRQLAQAFQNAGEQGAEALMRNPQYAVAAEKLSRFLDANPEIGDAFATIGNVGTIEGVRTGAAAAARPARELAARGGEAVVNTADEAFQSGISLKSRIQTAIARKNVHPQLGESATRLNKPADTDPLFAAGTKRLGNPLDAYEEYLATSKKAITDIKADPAISVVGEEIGDAFQSVVAQRRAVGEVMGSELKAVGKLKVGIGAAKTSLLSELSESGLAYNPRSKQLTSFTGSRFASPEVKMLEEFVQRLNQLGDTPTVSDIDNFIARTRSDLQFTKGQSGVIGTTNAERIINGAVAALKARLNPEVNGTPALRPYWEANRTYSELSDFVEEGSNHLGKLTQDGDFAKDASLAKSAVQSILNNGKKDWLSQLEALTGYPALDKAVLALQAMKDAGDFRGLSLLQQLVQGSIPTSKMGLIDKILGIGVEKAGTVLLGGPEEQTRAFLKSLVEEPPPQTSP